jgi:predicted amidohydrolase
VGLTRAERREWDEQGYILLRGFAEAAQVQALVERIVEIAREIDAGHARPELLVMPEKLLADAPTPERRLAKVFRVHGPEPRFAAVATDARIVDRAAELIGGDGRDVDCFLSQFIFKHPGAFGQP